MEDHFELRKKHQLEKDDKSLKGSWDVKIKNLCNRINLKDNYYTTSSCSGRVVILKDSRIKRDDLFLFVSHDKVFLPEIKEAINKIESKELIYFKQDPVILHVACRNLEDAQNLIDIATKQASWKRCGIIASDKRFVVELNSTEKIEFPLMVDGELLVDDDFLEVVIKESNRKLESTWNKINKLQELI